MKKPLFYALFLLFGFSAVQCTKDDNNNNNNNQPPAGTFTNGVWILNQGSFMGGNASVDFFSRNQSITSDVFETKNKRPLGDVLQSMSGFNGHYFLVMNNSASIQITDAEMASKGAIENLGSPRYMQIINNAKAYVTDISNNGIWIIDPTAMTKTGFIDYAPNGGGYNSWTEQLVLSGTDMYVTAPSVKRLLVINTQTDKITDSIVVTGQPQWIVEDKNNTVWALTNGQFSGDSSALYHVNTADKKIVKSLYFSTLKEAPSYLVTDKSGSNLYYIYKNGVYKMAVTDAGLPTQAFITLPSGSATYGLAIDPKTGDIYVADAIDYKSTGKVLHYSSAGELLSTQPAGVAPAGFYFVD